MTAPKSHADVAKKAKDKRAKAGFRTPRGVGACTACLGTTHPAIVGATSFAADLPWLPELVEQMARAHRARGITGDELVIEVLNEVYPMDNYYDRISWPVKRSSAFSFTQERVRRHIKAMRL